MPRVKEKKLPAPIDRLKARPRLFVREYMKDFNATQAAYRAGYTGATAGNQAFILLQRPDVKAALENEMMLRERRVKIDGDEIVRELVRIATTDVKNLFDESGAMLPLNALPPGLGKCIASVDVDEIWQGVGEARRLVGYSRKIRFWDKMKALELLGKHVKLFDVDPPGDRGNGPITYVAINNVPCKHPKEDAEPVDIQVAAKHNVTVKQAGHAA